MKKKITLRSVKETAKETGDSIIHIIEFLARLIFALCGVFLMIKGCAYVSKDEIAAGSTSIGLSIAVIIISNIEKFDFIKALGIEAKMRDKMKDAERITNQIKSMSEILCKSVAKVNLTLWQNGEDEFDEHRALIKNISAQMLENGAKKEDIDQIVSDWLGLQLLWILRYLLMEYRNEIIKEIDRLWGVDKHKDLCQRLMTASILNIKPNLDENINEAVLFIDSVEIDGLHSIKSDYARRVVDWGREFCESKEIRDYKNANAWRNGLKLFWRRNR